MILLVRLVNIFEIGSTFRCSHVHFAGPEAVSYIINQADIPLVICSADKLDKVGVYRISPLLFIRRA